MSSITRATHSINVIDEQAGHALIEITEDNTTTQRDKRFYVVGINRASGQVYSAVTSDMPDDGGVWCGKLSVSGVTYVAHAMTRATARRWFRRLVTETKELGL